jgi:Leucine-rich repeat (LRR) protein
MENQMKTNKNLLKTVLATLILGLGSQLMALECKRQRDESSEEEERALQPGETTSKKGRPISAVEDMTFNPLALNRLRWENQQNANLLTLQSNDGTDFIVSVHTAQLSETIRNLIEGAGTNTPIPLPTIDSKTLATIVGLLPDLEWLMAQNGRLPQVPENGVKYIALAPDQQDELLYIPRAFQPIVNDALQNVSTNDVIDLFLAANYLDLPFILNGAAAVLADRNVEQTQEDRIPKDLRPYIERHIIHRQCGLTQEYSIADYIKEHGQPKLEPNHAQLNLEKKKLTSLFGLTLIKQKTIKNTSTISLGQNCFFNFSLDPEGVEMPFKDFTNLWRLQLDDNQLVQLNSQLFTGLELLKQLGLDQNQLTQINPQWFAELENLEELALGANKITRIDLLALRSQLPSLRILILFSNQLNPLELQNSPMVRMLHLQVLDLEDNQFTEDQKNRIRQQLPRVHSLMF